MVQSVADLIDTKGAMNIAAALNMNPVAVRLWKHRDCIPKARWVDLIEAFPDVTPDLLRRISPEKAA